jgi:hypothetical protein
MEGVQSGREEIVNGLTAELIAAGADIAAWFVKNDDHLLFGKDALSIEPDVIRRCDACGELEAGRAVDLNATALDQFLTASPRANAAGCKVFIKSDSLRHDGLKKDRAGSRRGFGSRLQNEGLALVLGLRETDRGLSLFPFASLFEKLHALEALEDGTFAADGGA